MTPFLNDDEKERRVIDLYFNQGKNTREIAKLLRMSLSSIGPIIKKEREKRAVSYNVDNGDSGNGNSNGDARAGPRTQKQQQPHLQSEQQQEHQQQQQTSNNLDVAWQQRTAALKLSPKEKAAIAYRLYDEGKSPIQVACQLYLSAKEATKYFREFWALKHHYQLYRIYPEIQYHIPIILKFHKSLKKYGLTDKIEDIDYFFRVMETGGIKLPQVENDYAYYKSKTEEARNELQAVQQETEKMQHDYQYQKWLSEKDLQAVKQNILDLNNAQEQTQKTFDITVNKASKIREQMERTQRYVTRYQHTNRKYHQIKAIVEDQVTKMLNVEVPNGYGLNGKTLLTLALDSVIKALRENPDSCANVIFANNTNNNNDNNNGNDNNNTDEYRNGLLVLMKSFFQTFVNQAVNQTMATMIDENEA
jgi:transposase